MGEFVKVAETKDIDSGTGILVELGGERIALFNVNGTFYAIGDVCTHSEGPLSEGDLDGEVVTCPWHAAEFDVKTGAVLSPPASDPVPSYRVKVEGSAIHIETP
ncbi:MAG: non-heme iron oxygenase ferredoxin subunit [candidate division NC10 bacterium]|nr:non-heme iron oxygenase ferredoxin subunit [candidate division NC10 bacterium]